MILQQKVTYSYDAFDRLIGKQVDSNGDGTIDHSEIYVYDGNQIVLRFAQDTAGAVSASHLADRYLWGPTVDMLFADEAVTSLSSAGTVSWALGDNLNSIRDVVQYNWSTGTNSIVDHNTYDAFGNKTSQTSAAHDLLFGYTGKLFDSDTGLQNNWHRRYDPAIGRFISQDPILAGRAASVGDAALV